MGYFTATRRTHMGIQGSFLSHQAIFLSRSATELACLRIPRTLSHLILARNHIGRKQLTTYQPPGLSCQAKVEVAR